MRPGASTAISLRDGTGATRGKSEHAIVPSNAVIIYLCQKRGRECPVNLQSDSGYFDANDIVRTGARSIGAD